MKLVVGLGNPGDEYSNTRHNIGFMFLDFIINDEFSINKKTNAMEYTLKIRDEKVIFIKPLSYMNLSGTVIKKYVDFYKINFQDILVIQDDLDMSVGRYKILYNRGDGGHNGIKDIIRCLSTKEFYRLKVGISRSSDSNVRDYVLGNFSGSELSIVNGCFSKLENLVSDFVVLNRDSFIQKYNTKVDD